MEFFHTCVVQQQWKRTYTALIPKRTHALKLEHFRPIEHALLSLTRNKVMPRDGFPSKFYKFYLATN